MKMNTAVWEGGQVVTCAVAAELLAAGKVFKVWWRPNGKMSKRPGSDPALVWYNE